MTLDPEEDALAPKQIPAAALKIASTVLMFAPACRSLVHPPVKCVLGECAKGKCGISNKFSHVNGGRPIEFMQNFKPKELYFTCPVEAGTPRDTMSWNKWCKVPTGIDEFGDVEHLEQWPLSQAPAGSFCTNCRRRWKFTYPTSTTFALLIGIGSGQSTSYW